MGIYHLSFFSFFFSSSHQLTITVNLHGIVCKPTYLIIHMPVCKFADKFCIQNQPTVSLYHLFSYSSLPIIYITTTTTIIGTTAHFEPRPSSEASAIRPYFSFLDSPAFASSDFATYCFPEQVVSLASNPQQSWRTDWIASQSGSSSWHLHQSGKGGPASSYATPALLHDSLEHSSPTTVFKILQFVVGYHLNLSEIIKLSDSVFIYGPFHFLQTQHLRY